MLGCGTRVAELKFLVLTHMKLSPNGAKLRSDFVSLRSAFPGKNDDDFA